MKHLIFLILLLSSLTNLSAQNVQMLDSAVNISVVRLKDLENVDDYQLQFSITGFSMKDHRIVTVTPDIATGFRIPSSHRVFVSCRFEYGGEERQLFLRRTKIYQDSISFYVYYDDPSREKPIYFVRMGSEPKLYPLADNPSTGYVSPLRQWLMSYPIVEDEAVRRFFEQLQPTPESFEQRHRLALSRYASHLPHLRWGVQAGVSFSKVITDDYKMDLAASVSAGLFADVPLGRADGLSYHPELSFEKYAAKGKMYGQPTLSDVAYNTSTLATTQLLRYTTIWLPSRVLPYFELGAMASLNLKRSMEYKFIGYTYDDTSRYPIAKEYIGKEDLHLFRAAPVAGVGVEWQYARHHSLYVSTRFSLGLGHLSRMGGTLLIAFNL